MNSNGSPCIICFKIRSNSNYPQSKTANLNLNNLLGCKKDLNNAVPPTPPLSLTLSFYLYFFIYLSINLYLSIYQSIYLSIYILIYLSIYLPIYLSESLSLFPAIEVSCWWICANHSISHYTPLFAVLNCKASPPPHLPIPTLINHQHRQNTKDAHTRKKNMIDFFYQGVKKLVSNR